MPAILSDNVDAAKNFAAEQLSFFETMPSYQKVIAREGIASAVDLAAVGSAESVRRQLQSYLDAGATDVVAGWRGRASLWPRNFGLSPPRSDQPGRLMAG